MWRPQLLMGVIGIFIVGTALCCICSGIWIGAGQISLINQLAGLNITSIQGLGGIDIARNPVSLWYNALVTVFSWDYPFLDNPVGLFFRFFLGLLSIGTITSIVFIMINFIQGAISAVTNLISPR